MAEGEFHESLNLAALWRLPVLFCLREQPLRDGHRAGARPSRRPTSPARRASYGMPAEAVDGMDVAGRRGRRPAGGRRASAAGGGPHFLELRTYRFRAHSMYDPELYRDKARGRAWKRARPDRLLAHACGEAGLLHDGDLEADRGDVAAEIDAAVAFAEAGTWSRSRTSRGSSTPRGRRDASDRSPPDREPAGDASDLPGGGARRDARGAARDERVFLMGEDVGRYGGCYAVSQGLLEEFGPERVRDTPLSESAFVGAGIGAALGGMRPIVEIMTVNFSLLALDQIVNNAATLRHMSGGQFNVPLVIRMTTGAGRQLAAQHSHSLEGWYAHIPGLRVSPRRRSRTRAGCSGGAGGPRPGADLRARLAVQHGGRTAVVPGPVDMSKAAVRRQAKMSL